MSDHAGYALRPHPHAIAPSPTHSRPLWIVHSGTYSNMWIVVDYNKFVKGTPLLPNALTIAEQLPGVPPVCPTMCVCTDLRVCVCARAV